MSKKNTGKSSQSAKKEEEKRWGGGNIVKDCLLASAIAILILFNVVVISKVNSIEDKLSHVSDESTKETESYRNVTANEKETTAPHEQVSQVSTEAVAKESEKIPDVSLEDVSHTSEENKPGEGKTVYLTFDDGPSTNTRIVLDILDKYGIKATFFVVRTEDNDDLYREIVNRGHAIAVHSTTHDYNQIYANMDAYIDDVMGMREFIHDVTGVYTNLYRFPGGSSSTIGNLDRGDCIRFLNENGIKYFDWNVSSGDASANYISPDEIIANVYTTLGIYDNSVILMHDSLYKTSTMVALDELIEKIAAEGYTFKAIDMDTEPVQQLLYTNY